MYFYLNLFILKIDTHLVLKLFSYVNDGLFLTDTMEVKKISKQ